MNFKNDSTKIFPELPSMKCKTLKHYHVATYGIYWLVLLSNPYFVPMSLCPVDNAGAVIINS